MRTQKTRDSGIELLRILTMLGVILLHYNDGRAFDYAASGSAHQITLFLLESTAICAVDLFILISGYYLSKTQKRSLLKPLELVVELIIVRFINYAVMIAFGKLKLSIGGILTRLIPSNYFLVLYSTLYFISPYLNICLKKLQPKQLLWMLMVLMLLFSFWNTFVDVFEEIMGTEWFGLSTVTAWGNKQGFNIVNFVLLYMIGGFLRYYPIPDRLQDRRILTVCWIVTVAFIFGWSLVCDRLHLTELRSAWVYHNPLVILSAVTLFLLFHGFQFHIRIINDLATASFTCFLIHRTFLDYVGIASAVGSSVPLMLVHIIIVAAGIYLISWLFYKLYHFSTGWFFKLLQKAPIFQNREIP